MIEFYLMVFSYLKGSHCYINICDVEIGDFNGALLSVSYTNGWWRFDFLFLRGLCNYIEWKYR